MALVLNEEQQLLQDSVRDFCRKEAPVSDLRRLRDTGDETGFSAETWQAMSALGLSGLLISEDFGGSNFGYVAAGVVLEEMGRNLSASPFFASSVLAASAIMRAANDQQKAKWLPQIAAGDLVATLAVDEKPRHAPEHINVRADASGALSGLKTFVPDGHVAQLLIVVAQSDQGPRLYAVERGAAGLITDRTVMADSRNWAKVTLSDTPAELLTESTPEAISAILDAGRIVLSSELMGIARECLDVTVAYLKDRKQFGVAIGTFQALQHRAAHLFSEIEVARSAVLAALQAIDTAVSGGGASLAVMASLAKAKACQAADLATNEAIQMHGGIGMTDEYDIGFYIKRARTIQQYLGDYSFHADRFARLKGF